MKKYRPVLAAVLALTFYTFTDILIWQRIFEANQMVQYADIYHTGWFVSLAGYAIIGIVLMWDAWKDIAYFLISLFVGAFSGLEDCFITYWTENPCQMRCPGWKTTP